MSSCAVQPDSNEWTRFPPTVEAFARYLDSRADSLHPLEGLWSERAWRDPDYKDRRPTRTRSERPSGLTAIVRDTTVPPYEYAAVGVEWEETCREQGWECRRGLVAMRLLELRYDSTSETTILEVRRTTISYGAPPDAPPRVFEARLQWNLLTFPAMYKTQWFKEYPRDGPF